MRTRSVRAAFPDGQFPPITVFRIDRAYFVEDGHHRVAVARALGMEFVDAVVTEVKSTYRFDEHLGSEDVALLEAEHDFRARTGLATARPDTRFTLSSPAGYVDLAETVRSHGYELSLTAGDVVPRTQVAAHWHDCVYQPLLDELVARGCRDLLVAASDAELLLAVYRTQAALQASAADGCAAFVEAARETAASMERLKGPALERLRAVARGPAGKRWGVLRRALRRARAQGEDRSAG